MIVNHINSAKCGRGRYKNFLEDEKQRLVQYRKNYFKMYKKKKRFLKILVRTYVKRRYTES